MKDFLGSLTADQQKELTNMLRDMEGQKDNNSEDSPETSIGEDFTVNRGSANKKGRAPVSGGENTWEDVGELKEVETPHFERTPRSRPLPKTAEVSCHVCGKSFKVNSSLLSGKFSRCDRCTGK
jgi:hypothetical protein